MMNELQKFYNWINCEGGGFVLKAVILYIMIGAAIGGILVAASEAEEDKLFIEVLATAIWPVYVAFFAIHSIAVFASFVYNTSVKKPDADGTDITSVIRCKSCRSYCGTRQTSGYCTRTGERVKEHDFCSHGERDEGKGETSKQN